MKRITTLGTFAGVALGITAALTLAFGKTAPSVERGLRVDSSPPLREGPLGGYADIVEKVSPGVVSVFATKKAEPVDFSGHAELFNDPRFRRFFGDALPGSPGGRQFTPKQEGLGSGVILTEDGYIVTNNHVIDGADKVVVTLTDKGEEFDAEVIGADPQTDLAVLKIDATGLSAVTLGDSALLKAGDTVLAIGNPFGLSKTVTSGIVSAIGRSDLNIAGYENFIQTDASINPGNSGGALVDNRGHVVGINTAILSRTGGNVGIGFAIPIQMATRIIDQLVETGTIERGYLGVLLSELTPELAQAMNAEHEGVLVNDVMPGTPAAKAGMKNGDIITAFNGTPAREMSKLRLSVVNTAPGEEATFTVRRDGAEKKLHVTIGRLPSEDLTASADPGRRRSAREEEAVIVDGVMLTEIARLSVEKRGALGISEDAGGLVVSSVDPGSNAAEAGLRPGDVVTEISGQPVNTIAEATAAAKKARNNTVLLRVANSNGNRYLAVPVG